MLRPAPAPDLSLEMDCLRLILKWKNSPLPLSMKANYHGCRCTIIVERAGDPLPLIDANALTDCQSDILDVLRAVAPKRLTKPKIINALDDAKKFHGVSTVALALVALGTRGLIARPRPKSRDGYGITSTGEI